jgi:hypothetical protein
LGTSGPFTLVVDYGLGSEEKILCASGAISLGVNTAIFVYNVGGTNGRGYDGTVAVSHSIGSASDYNVFPVSTAIEQAQFNYVTSKAIVSGMSAGGDLSGNYPNPTLKTIGTSGTWYPADGQGTAITVDNAGRVTSLSGINLYITQAQVSGLVSFVNSTNANVSINTNDIGVVSGQVSALSGQFVTLSGQVGTLNSQVSTLNSQFVTLSGQVGTLSGEVSTLNSQFVTLSGQVDNNTIAISGLNSTVSGEAVAISGLSTRIDTLSSTTNSQFDNVNTQISGLNVVVSGQANTLATEANNIATLSGQYVTLSGNLVTTNSNVANLSGQFASLSGSYNVTSGIVTNQTGYIATLSGQMITANNGISTNAANLATLSGQYNTTSGIVTNHTSYISTISGKQVTDENNIVTLSGNIVAISGKQVTDEANIASLSGSLVTLSGQFVTTSGRTIFSGTTAGGDLTGTYPNPTLRTISGVNGTYGSATQTPLLSIDSNGRITNAQLYTIQIDENQVNNLTTDMTSISGNIASVSGKQVTDASNIASLSGSLATLSGQYVSTSGIVTNHTSYISTISGKQVTDEANIASISGSLSTVSGVAYAALPRTGGTISGSLTVTGTLSVNSTNIALGANTPISSANVAGVAIGNYAGQTSNNNGVAVGGYAGSTQNFDGVAVGYEAGYYYNEFGVAIGYLANVNNTSSQYTTAIGYQVNATAPGSVAIGTDHTGTGATSSTQDQIVLGTSNHTVNVPGTLTVSGIKVLTSISGITASGDLQGTYPNPTISTALSGTISTNTTNIATVSGVAYTNQSNIATLSGSTVTLGTTQTISGIKTFTGTTTFSGLTYYPTFPTGTYELANKQYVDAAVAQLNVHAPAFAGTTGNLTATYSGGTIDQDGGYGIGATLTSTTNAGFAIDSIAASGFVNGARILVKDQTTGTQNGIYVVTVTGSSSIPWKLTRSSDYNDSISGQVTAGDFVFVQSGTVNANNGFVMNSAGAGPNGDIIIGTDTIGFSQFSGAGQINAGDGLTKTGNTINVVTANSSRIVVNPDSIDLATIGASGTYGSVNNISIITTDGYGRVNSITTSGIQIAESQVTNLTTDLTNISGTLTTNTSNISSTSGSLATLSGQFVSLSGSYATTSGNLNTTNTNVANLSGQYATLSGQYAATSGIVTNQTSYIAATSGSLATLSGQFVALSGSYNTTSGIVTNQTGYIATLSGQVVTLSGSDANKLPLGGGTVTGTLNVNSPFNVNGNVSITGTETISGALNVNYTINATTPTTNPPINFGGGLSYSDVNTMAGFNNSVNNYNQVIIQNTNSGTSASTNLNVSNNLGTSGTNFGEFGMNSSNFTGTGSFNTAGTVYLSSASTDLAIGTYGNNAIHFVTNGSTNDAMTITSGGNVVVASGLTVSGATNISNYLTVASGLTLNTNSIALGATASAYASYGVALGYGANVSGFQSVALGYTANASGQNSVALGGYSNAALPYATALGAFAVASGQYSTALGGSAKATASGSVAIGIDANGNGVTATGTNQFVLGTSNHNVQVPGTFAVSGSLTVSGTAVMTSGSAVGGDLTGTIGNAKVIKLQGYTVSSGAPTANAILVYSGSQWVSGPVVSGTTGTGGIIPYATNPLLVAPLEQVVVTSGVISSSAAATLNVASGGVYVYTAAPTSAWQIQITNVPTTVGQAVTVTVGTNNGSTAYLPSGFTINGFTVNGGTTLPAHGTAYTNTYTVTAYYQGGTQWSAADATINYDFYAITLICTAANTYVMLLGQTKF